MKAAATRTAIVSSSSTPLSLAGQTLSLSLSLSLSLEHHRMQQRAQRSGAAAVCTNGKQGRGAK